MLVFKKITGCGYETVGELLNKYLFSLYNTNNSGQE